MTIELTGFKEPILIVSVGQIDELYEFMEEKKPIDKRSKQYKTWKNQINTLAEICNQMVKFKRYRIIK